MGNIFKSWFFEAKVIILTWYVKPNETMAINKFQRSTFDFLAKVAINILKHSFLRNHLANWTKNLYELRLLMIC